MGEVNDMSSCCGLVVQQKKQQIEVTEFGLEFGDYIIAENRQIVDCGRSRLNSMQ